MRLVFFSAFLWFYLGINNGFWMEIACELSGTARLCFLWLYGGFWEMISVSWSWTMGSRMTEPEIVHASDKSEMTSTLWDVYGLQT